MNKKQLGKKGEDLALKHLQNKGYRFVDRNFQAPTGEIDLIVKKAKTLVFVEVKTRWSQKYGSPQSAVTSRKLKNLTKTALWFKSQTSNLPDQMRIDVIAIQVDADGNLTNLDHIENVTG